jgi:hypothetical protein
MLFYAVIQCNASVLLLHKVLQQLSSRSAVHQCTDNTRSGNEILRLKYLNGYYTKYK